MTSTMSSASRALPRRAPLGERLDRRGAASRSEAQQHRARRGRRRRRGRAAMRPDRASARGRARACSCSRRGRAAPLARAGEVGAREERDGIDAAARDHDDGRLRFREALERVVRRARVRRVDADGRGAREARRRERVVRGGARELVLEALERASWLRPRRRALPASRAMLRASFARAWQSGARSSASSRSARASSSVRSGAPS